MIIVYTGNGKGKTSAATGQAVRALGWGARVCFGQFMKRDGQAGEQFMLKKLLGNDFCPCGPGFFLEENQRPEQRKSALEVLEWSSARTQSGVDMLVLDEAIYALNLELISREEVEKIIKVCRESGAHLVLTGRYPPEWLLREADLVSEIQVTKHPFQEGKQATQGIEF